MSITTTISYQDGAAGPTVNLANNTNAYVTPGNNLTLALQVSTGVQQWTISIQSDYAPLNGFILNSSGPVFQTTIILPQQTCYLKITSEATDGFNVFSSSNILYNYPKQAATDRSVRYVCTSNVAISNCNVIQDGVTGVQGDRILLVAQTNGAQCGPYIVGAVAANLAALTRPPDYFTGLVLTSTPLFEVSEGTSWANSTWKLLGPTADGANPATVDTTNTYQNFSNSNTVAYFPRVVLGTIANVAANGNIASTWLTSSGVVLMTDTTSNGAVASNVTSNAHTAGAGTASFTPAGGVGHSANYAILNW